MMLIISLRQSFHTPQINRLPAYVRTAETKHALPLAISLFMNIGLPCQRCMGGSGIRSAVGAVVGLCSRWEAGSLPQRVCGAMSLRDCTVGMWGFYTDPVSPAMLFVFFAGNLVVS
jgi:hypothetical protein